MFYSISSFPQVGPVQDRRQRGRRTGGGGRRREPQQQGQDAQVRGREEQEEDDGGGGLVRRRRRRGRGQKDVQGAQEAGADAGELTHKVSRLCWIIEFKKILFQDEINSLLDVLLKKEEESQWVNK